MKTTLLFAAALVISTASFSQTTVKATESANANATADAGLKTGTITKATDLAKKTEKQTVNYAKAEKNSLKNDQTSVSANASLKSNNSGKDASLDGQTAVAANSTTSSSISTKTATVRKPV